MARDQDNRKETDTYAYKQRERDVHKFTARKRAIEERHSERDNKRDKGKHRERRGERELDRQDRQTWRQTRRERKGGGVGDRGRVRERLLGDYYEDY